jgi:hypothetical protein
MTVQQAVLLAAGATVFRVFDVLIEISSTFLKAPNKGRQGVDACWYSIRSNFVRISEQTTIFVLGGSFMLQIYLVSCGVIFELAKL